MAEHELTGTDSAAKMLGLIPGSAQAPAFTLQLTEPSALPVLIAVPHAGRHYPPGLIARMHNPGLAGLRLEDRLVDRLGEAVARRTGAALLTAHAPRAMIDLNRSESDVDWDMVRDAESDLSLPFGKGLRVRSGLGLVPRRLPGIGELWKDKIDHGELNQRIAAIHRPYHACLADTLAQLRARWGAALLLDLHSMPPLGQRGGPRGAEFVIGDRYGAACHGALVGAAFGHFAREHRIAAHNRPYAGGFGLERHARPEAGLHALQLEIDRSCYLDSRLAELGEGFAGMVDLLCGLVSVLAEAVVELGRQDALSAWPQAAE